MHRFTYVSSRNVVLDLDGEFNFSGIGADFRSSEWSYNLGAKRVTGLTRNAREVELELFGLSISEADNVRREFERDTVNQTPGTFIVDGWQQRAYVVASQLDSIHDYADTLTAKFTAVLLDGEWRKPITQGFTHALDVVNEWLDYPHDYSHDYGISSYPDEVISSAISPSPIKLIIYGPASNPYVTIGSNRYQVNVSVSQGGRLEVDGINHTIMIYDAFGHAQNVFDAGVRGTGAGSGTYVFEKLPVGVSNVSWPTGFGFDLTHYMVEGVPPWSR